MHVRGSPSRVVHSCVFLLSGCRPWVYSRAVMSVRGTLVVCPADGLPLKWRTSLSGGRRHVGQLPHILHGVLSSATLP